LTCRASLLRGKLDQRSLRLLSCSHCFGLCLRRQALPLAVLPRGDTVGHLAQQALDLGSVFRLEKQRSLLLLLRSFLALALLLLLLLPLLLLLLEICFCFCC